MDKDNNNICEKESQPTKQSKKSEKRNAVDFCFCLYYTIQKNESQPTVFQISWETQIKEIFLKKEHSVRWEKTENHIFHINPP